MPNAQRAKIVIIGGGFAGIAAARTFKGEPVDVVVIDRSNHHVFQPLLYQVATATLAPSDIAVPIRWMLRRQANVRVVMGEVTGISVDERRVVLDRGTLENRMTTSLLPLVLGTPTSGTMTGSRMLRGSSRWMTRWRSAIASCSRLNERSGATIRSSAQRCRRS